jgi:hypothetical protein
MMMITFLMAGTMGLLYAMDMLVAFLCTFHCHHRAGISPRALFFQKALLARASCREFASTPSSGIVFYLLPGYLVPDGIFAG